MPELKNFIFIVSLFIVLACSSEKTSLTSLAYQDITAHYNGYYYSREEINKIEYLIQQNHQDDFNKILKLFPSTDSLFAKSYEASTEEAIKMASIAIQRHPQSKWVDDAYILVGKARLYSLDWGNAIQTFKYVNGNSKDPNARHRSVINLVRTFTEHQEFNNALAAIDFLEKEKLNKSNKKALLLEKAFYYQTREEYDNMVSALTEVQPLLTKKDKPGRIYFIIGQVYQKLGFESEAYNYYKKCLNTNPVYEVDFYARLYMAQVAEISKSKSLSAARKSFRKLLKDSKNREFKDKIYYEMGAFELKQWNIDEAMVNFNLSVRQGNNKKIDGEAYLRMGEIYYDTLKNYSLAQAYYDSAVSALPKDYENYPAIKTRQEILNDFVNQINTIQWQDSLLVMSEMDSVQLKNKVDSVFKAKKEMEDNMLGKKKKRKLIAIEKEDSNLFSGGEFSLESSTWYFGNPSAMALGENEFKRVWGNISLSDDWRRSVRTTSNQNPLANNLDENKGVLPNEEIREPLPSDPAEAEFNKIVSQLPRTEEQKQEALSKIENAYFKLGTIYHLNLNKIKETIETYEILLSRFPDSEYIPEVYFKLQLILKDSNPEKSKYYADLLLLNYPNSNFSKLYLNPDYFKESGETAEKQREWYNKAYTLYKETDFREAKNLVTEALGFGETSFSPRLKLLDILLIGEMEDHQQYQKALAQFIDTNPDSEITPYAKTLLKAVQDFSVNPQNIQREEFFMNPDDEHQLVLAFHPTTNLSLLASRQLNSFSKSLFPQLSLKIANIALSEDYILTTVSGLKNKTEAEEFYRVFLQNQTSMPDLAKEKFYKFVITTENFNTLYRTKALDEYLRFFEKNYVAKNP